MTWWEKQDSVATATSDKVVIYIRNSADIGQKIHVTSKKKNVERLRKNMDLKSLQFMRIVENLDSMTKGDRDSKPCLNE